MRAPLLHLLSSCLVASLLARPAPAEPAADIGTLNPEEMSIARVLQDVARGETGMTICAAGYLITKKGDHEDARRVFRACAAEGWTGAMTWLAQLDDNGLGRAGADPEAAAQWDRRAAEAGDPVGLFNHGLALLRGHGTAPDAAAGRALVDRAAAAGLPVARRLQAAGYDPQEVTPDADNWKYEERLY